MRMGTLALEDNVLKTHHSFIVFRPPYSLRDRHAWSFTSYANQVIKIASFVKRNTIRRDSMINGDDDGTNSAF